MKIERRVSRDLVLKNIREQMDKGIPIIATGAGVGIVGRVAEKADADLIVVYNSGYFRMNGHSSILGNLPVGDANGIVREMGEKHILPVVHKTPVIAGVFGSDPTRDMRSFLSELAGIGYSGVINYPTVGKFSGQFRREVEEVGLGFSCEIRMIRLAAEMGFLTMGYVYSPEEARLLVDAGADIIVSHVGLTGGGDVGMKCEESIDEAILKTQKVLEEALKRNPAVIPLCHGGSISSQEDFARVFNETCSAGFVGASSIERIPVERALYDTISSFKGIRKTSVAR